MKKRNTVFISAIIILILIIIVLIGNNLSKPKEGNLIQINYKNIQQKINQKETFILVVSKSTCSHCATYKPKLKTIAKNYGIDIYYIDYDQEKSKEKFLKNFNLSGATPITLFIEKGKEKSILNRIEGDVPTTKIINKLKTMNYIK